MTVSQGKRFDLARDTSVQAISAQTWSSSGLATEATAAGSFAQLQTGVPPAVPNYQTGDAILQGPTGSPFTLFTMTADGRIWAALVTMSMGSTGGAGSNHGYARVYTSGGKTLALVELCVVGNPDKDSGVVGIGFNGIPIVNGASVLLDVNGGATITGVTIRGSGLVGVSMP
jgi:hypothetical protein